MLEDPIHDGANDSVIDKSRDLLQLAAVRPHEEKRVVCLAALLFALFRECTPIRPSAGRA